jgi:hypothetical protein
MQGCPTLGFLAIFRIALTLSLTVSLTILSRI